MGIREILRQLRKGRSARAVARAMGVDRKTLARYRDWAAVKGQDDLTTGDLSPGDLALHLEGRQKDDLDVLCRFTPVPRGASTLK